MRRLRLAPTWHLVLFGFAIGLVVASTITIVSARRYDDRAVYLLGSGSGLSALITGKTHRILVVGGDDPSALANAFAVARPAMLRRIDLVVLLPGATERVADRAVEIARPTRLYALPNQRFHPAGTILGQPIRPMDGPSSFRLGYDLLIDLYPDANAGWSIRIASGAGIIILTERTPIWPEANLVAVTGQFVPDSVIALDLPVFVSADAAPDEWMSSAHENVTTIEPGAVRKITLRLESISVSS